jgi:hypothetical protein
MRVWHNCGLIGHALRESVNIWRNGNAPERECAREFCDLIERLP